MDLKLFWKLFCLLRRMWLKIALYCLLSTIRNTIKTTVLSIVLALAFAQFTHGNMTEYVYLAGVVFFGRMLVESLDVPIDSLEFRLILSVENELRDAIYDKLFRLSKIQVALQNREKLHAEITSIVSNISSFLDRLCVNAFPLFVTIIIGAAILLTTNFVLGTTVLLGEILFGVIYAFRRVKDTSKDKILEQRSQRLLDERRNLLMLIEKESDEVMLHFLDKLAVEQKNHNKESIQHNLLSIHVFGAMNNIVLIITEFVVMLLAVRYPVNAISAILMLTLLSQNVRSAVSSVLQGGAVVYKIEQLMSILDTTSVYPEVSVDRQPLTSVPASLEIHIKKAVYPLILSVTNPNIVVSRPRSNTHYQASMRFPEGLILIDGRSGSGKTTTLRIIRQLLKPTEGHVILLDSNGRILPLKSARVILMDPDLSDLFVPGTIRENLVRAIPPSLEVPNNTQLNEMLRNVALERLSLDFPLNSQAGNLSGGERKRLALLIAALKEPHILLLDEPLESLDEAESVKAVCRYIAELKQHMIVIVTSHKTEPFKHIAEYVYVMQEGQVLKHGTFREVYE